MAGEGVPQQAGTVESCRPWAGVCRVGCPRREVGPSRGPAVAQERDDEGHRHS